MELARRDGMIAEIGEQLQQHQALLRANANLQRVPGESQRRCAGQNQPCDDRP
jgi:hypothetical protein